jgi:hypothetical protein
MPRTLVAGGGRAGQALRTYSCFDFRGGLDVLTSPALMAGANTSGARNRLIEATNVAYHVDGSVSKRWGIKQSTGGLFANSPILGGTEFITSDGLHRTLFALADGTVRQYVADAVEPIGLTTVGSGLTNSLYRPSFATFQDVVFMANGVDALQQYDGITWSAVGGGSPTKPRAVAAHANRLFASSMDVRSRLSWCKLNNPTDWTGVDDAGFLDVNPNDGGELLGLVPSIQELALLKTQRPYRLQGIGPVTGYTVADSLTPSVGSIGVTNKTAAVFALNDVWYLSQMGLHRLSATDQFGDLSSGLVSDLIQPYFRPVWDVFQGGDFQPAHMEQGYLEQVDAPQLVHDAGNDLLLFGQSRAVDGVPYLTRLLVYDLRIKAWSEWNYDNAGQGKITCLWPGRAGTARIPDIKLGLINPEIPVAVVGSLKRYAEGDTQKNDFSMGLPLGVAAGIPTMVSHISVLGAPGLRKCPRYLFVYFAPQAASATVTVEIFYDQIGYDFTVPDVTTSFDIHAVSTESRLVKRIDLGRHLCEYMTVRVRNAGVDEMFTFLGYEVLWSPRRFIRRAE